MLKWLPNHHVKLVKKKIHHDQIIIYKKKKQQHTEHIACLGWISSSLDKWPLCKELCRARKIEAVPQQPSDEFWESEHPSRCSLTFCLTMFPVPLLCIWRLDQCSLSQQYPDPIHSTSAIKVKAMRVHVKSWHDSTRIRPTDNKSPLLPLSPNDILLI